jgi:hypothetical protein
MTTFGGPNVFPGSKTFLGVTREQNAGSALQPGTMPGIAGQASTIPLDKSSFEPEDMPHWLPDEALRGNMAQLYNMILGPEDATFSYGGPFFGDMEGFFLDNVFGDLSSFYTGTLGSTSTISGGGGTIGSTSVTLASTAGFTIGGFAQFESTASTIAEIVSVTGTATNILSFGNTPLRFVHANGGTVSSVQGGSAPVNPFSHTFALLNSQQGYGGALGAQPPTHTFGDYLGPMTGLGNSPSNLFGMRLYPSSCIMQLDFQGNSEQLLQAKANGSSWVSVPAGTAPTNAISTVVPVPNWRTNILLGVPGSPTTLGTVFTIGEYNLSLKRQLQVYFTDQNSQNPYIIARGPLDATGTLNFTAPGDETALQEMLQNTQPKVQITINNGSAATALTYVSLTFNFQQAAFTKSKPSRSAVLVSYENEFQAVANSTNIGGSGGEGPVTVTLVNAVPTY